MPTTEHTINDALAARLRETRHAWRESNIVRSENTGMLKDSAGRPDILVLEPNVSPVVIETEIVPAQTVEEEATDRLGCTLKSNGQIILSSLAVRLPASLARKNGRELDNAISQLVDLEICIFTGSGSLANHRWPAVGWIKGSIFDLSVFVQSASLPPALIEKAADQLVAGVNEAAGLMSEMAHTHGGAIHKISQELLQDDGEQTRRMAATILANAFVYHGVLAGGPDELETVKSIDELRGSNCELSKSKLLEEWRKILKLNYWAIFDIARRILEHVPAQYSKVFVRQLAATADRLLSNRMMRSHDLTGYVFQKLIVDRKFLAAYYTTPASAALLVGLSISPHRNLANTPWGDAEKIKKLRIADFACGTGTLLSSAYQRIGQLHELAGGDAEAVHADMMAHSLIGCDVLPAAAHLTASMLAGSHPTVVYEDTHILTVKYGRQPDDQVRLGSLDLLDEQGRVGNVAITAKSIRGKGEQEKETWWTLGHGTFDFVIMNPPFTRDTGQEGKKIGVANPMFAAFAATDEDQREMARLLKELTKKSSAHGNAGEGSVFLVLANRKLKLEGTLALVLPLSLLSGDAWAASRKLLASNYTDLVVISIAGSADDDSSFSADTDMAECLIVGRKGTPNGKRATFVVLKERPSSPMMGSVAARQIEQLVGSESIRRIEDGPVGGTPIYFGDTVIGHVVEAPINQADPWTVARPWNVARLADIALGQAAYQLAENNNLWLPGMIKPQVLPIPIKNMAELALKIGPYHADINATNTSTGTVRGPFNITPIVPGTVPTYSALWSHDATTQRTMMFDADSEATPKLSRKKAEQQLIDAKVKRVLDYASHCHFNRDFRFNSQPTGMQFTPRRSLGGSAWICIRLASTEQEKALVLWANTSLGLLLHWWHANKQQSGRGRIGVAPLDSLPTLDITSLSKTQMAHIVKIFDETSQLSLLPFHQIDRDTTRHEIDERFGREVLGLDAKFFGRDSVFDLLRRKLAAEPSIRGNKKAAAFEEEDDE